MSLRGWVFTLCVIMLASCSLLPKGTVTLNDPTPNLPVVAQGAFVGLSGQTASGTAIAYADSGSPTSILRLNGVTFPSESNLVIWVTAGGGQRIGPIPLRATTGNQNYSVSISDTTVWELVTIHSQLHDLDYAQALMR